MSTELKNTGSMTSGDLETKELVCNKRGEKAAAPPQPPAASAEFKQVARDTYDEIDRAQTFDEWKLVVEKAVMAQCPYSTVISGLPTNSEQLMRRKSFIRCSHQLLYVLEWFSDPMLCPSLLSSDDKKGYEMAKNDCVKEMSPRLEAELESALCDPAAVRMPAAVLKIVVWYLIPEPTRRDTTMHNRDSSEYSDWFAATETLGKPESDDEDLE